MRQIATLRRRKGASTLHRLRLRQNGKTRRGRVEKLRTRSMQRSIAEAEVRKRYGVIIVAIKRYDGQMVFNPDAQERIRSGDILVTIGPKQALAGIEAACETQGA